MTHGVRTRLQKASTFTRAWWMMRMATRFTQLRGNICTQIGKTSKARLWYEFVCSRTYRMHRDREYMAKCIEKKQYSVYSIFYDACAMWRAAIVVCDCFFYFRQIRTQSTWIFQLFHLSKWDLVFIYCCSKWRPYYLALNDNAPYRSKHSDKSRKTLTRRLTLSLSHFPLHHKKQYFQR